LVRDQAFKATNMFLQRLTNMVKEMVCLYLVLRRKADHHVSRTLSCRTRELRQAMAL